MPDISQNSGLGNSMKNPKAYKMLSFKYSASSFFKRRLFNFLTQPSMDIFLRGNDIISVGPQIFGGHEQFLTRLIENVANNSHSNFFIDIGANIGLSSCQNGRAFDRVICFEPNPLCANVLKTNLAITLDGDKFDVREYGLGDADGIFDLFVPKHNWGGAFLREHNSYSEALLTSKDEFCSFDISNYTVEKVRVKNAASVLEELFEQLLGNNLIRGVIKIDVEGYERLILSALAKVLPAGIEIIVVFENFDPNLNIQSIRDSFGKRDVFCSKVERSIIGKKKSALKKFIEFGLFGEKTSIKHWQEADDVVGDIIFDIR